MANFTLTCSKGQYAGANIALDGNLPIGRDPQRCKLIISNGGGISSLHCEVRVTANGATLTDMGSTNGTFYMGRRLAQGETVYLNNGDSFYIADGTNEFRIIQTAVQSDKTEYLPQQFVPPPPPQQHAQPQPQPQVAISESAYAPGGVYCPVCKSKNLQILTSDVSNTTAKKSGTCSAIIGVLCLNWVGLLCGFINSKTKSSTVSKTEYNGYKCMDCGYEFYGVSDFIKRKRQLTVTLIVAAAILVILGLVIAIAFEQLVGLVLLIPAAVCGYGVYPLQKQIADLKANGYNSSAYKV